MVRVKISLLLVLQNAYASADRATNLDENKGEVVSTDAVRAKEHEGNKRETNAFVIEDITNDDSFFNYTASRTTTKSSPTTGSSEQQAALPAATSCTPAKFCFWMLEDGKPTPVYLVTWKQRMDVNTSKTTWGTKIDVPVRNSTSQESDLPAITVGTTGFRVNRLRQDVRFGPGWDRLPMYHEGFYLTKIPPGQPTPDEEAFWDDPAGPDVVPQKKLTRWKFPPGTALQLTIDRGRKEPGHVCMINAYFIDGNMSPNPGPRKDYYCDEKDWLGDPSGPIPPCWTYQIVTEGPQGWTAGVSSLVLMRDVPDQLAPVRGWKWPRQERLPEESTNKCAVLHQRDSLVPDETLVTAVTGDHKARSGITQDQCLELCAATPKCTEFVHKPSGEGRKKEINCWGKNANAGPASREDDATGGDKDSSSTSARKKSTGRTKEPTQHQFHVYSPNTNVGLVTAECRTHVLNTVVALDDGRQLFSREGQMPFDMKSLPFDPRWHHYDSSDSSSTTSKSKVDGDYFPERKAGAKQRQAANAYYARFDGLPGQPLPQGELERTSFALRVGETKDASGGEWNLVGPDRESKFFGQVRNVHHENVPGGASFSKATEKLADTGGILTFHFHTPNTYWEYRRGATKRVDWEYGDGRARDPSHLFDMAIGRIELCSNVKD
ncbi:unnamed protein product [Amoebophrya sp. A120]|nr:unnamed protein product [Amoebophrya sp. A120]|eukprot:GSA120T00020102001.1